MLPSNLQQSTSNKFGHQQPPLGITGVLCESHQLPIPNRGVLHYTVFRPRYINLKPPLVAVPGGPLLSCQYLQTIVHLVNDRSVVLYDPIGCGQSSADKHRQQDEDTADAQIQRQTLDLAALLQALNTSEFHLFGHSFGGILCYEYLKLAENKRCCSLIFASTPHSIADSLQVSEDLLEAIRKETDDEQAPQLFWERHECRVKPMPLALQQTLESAQVSASGSRQLLQTVAGYKATPPPSSCPPLPPALMVRGEYDFITEQQTHAWIETWQEAANGNKCIAQDVTLPNCSHYALLEDETTFGRILSTWLRQHDPPGNARFIP